MALSIARFDLRVPGLEPAEVSRRYQAALDMAAFADEVGMDMVVLSEHHGTDDGYLPSPLIMAGAVAARTTRIGINISALLVPLHDPLRLAEDLSVLDHISGGRLSTVVGLGYRPAEYVMFEQEWRRRGRRMDESLDLMLAAWRGEPIERGGESVVVTPAPLSRPHPMVMVGGSGEAAVKRAARLGLGVFLPVNDQSLVDLYHAECERLGGPAGLALMPSGPGTLVVADDPDEAWAELGPYLLHDAVTYNSWQSPDIRSHVKAEATTVEGLRAEGVYQILTPDEAVALATELGPLGPLTLHPMCGGTPPELAWKYLRHFADAVLPRLG
jgi:alkanesulfonate monooxygenase SsuD/methylene tetrahydromethanopterin reductase-like flavin-dependent oxidoreductase (luciferase family)